MANTMASSFIVAMSSPVRMCGAETPTKTSAPTRASLSVPLIPLALVCVADHIRAGCSPEAMSSRSG